MEKDENVRKLINKIEVKTSRNSKENKRNGTGPQKPSKVNQIREMF